LTEFTSSAPGRVNLIGEHTDYNDGFVLPLAIPLSIHASLVRRDDRVVQASTVNGSSATGSYEVGSEKPLHTWLDYVQGVTWALARSHVTASGFSLSLRSTLPAGKGLSSSAALEVSVLRALRSAYALSLTDFEIAKLAFTAETEFVGVPVGMMDQMACSLGQERSALFIDTRTLSYEFIDLPEPCGIGVVDSGLTHRHSSGEYRQRRDECRRAAAALGVASLRDLTEEEASRFESLPAPLGKRARHVFTENSRVLAAVEALRAGDLRRLGALINQSHSSLRDDFEVSLPQIDRLVEIAQSQPEVFGARLTGGGFGGSIVIVARADRLSDVINRITNTYNKLFNLSGCALLPRQTS